MVSETGINTAGRGVTLVPPGDAGPAVPTLTLGYGDLITSTLITPSGNARGLHRDGRRSTWNVPDLGTLNESFLSIEQCRSLVDRIRNDRCTFVGETAVPLAAVCRRHDSGAEPLVRAGQNLVPVRLAIPYAE